MPLSKPKSPREELHQRNITCRGYRREDGLWDIEAHMTDVKSYGFDNHDRGRIEAGEPLHQMWLRVTIDDEFLIREVEAVTDHGPFHICGDIAPSFSDLAGLRVGPGFLKEMRQRYAGRHGCTHIVELFGPLATTAYQTMFPMLEKKAQEAPVKKKPRVIDSCHALSSHGEVVKRNWPEFYEGSDLQKTEG